MDSSREHGVARARPYSRHRGATEESEMTHGRVTHPQRNISVRDSVREEDSGVFGSA